MTVSTSRDATGQRGEALFYVLITKLHGRPEPIFRPQFLGDKWPSVDFIVELTNSSSTVIPFFFVQVKTTRQGYTKSSRRLKVRVAPKDAKRLVSIPAPTYVVGIDEVNEMAYITSANEQHLIGLNSLSTRFLIDKETQDRLYREVDSFWQRHSKSGMMSQFVDPDWR